MKKNSQTILALIKKLGKMFFSYNSSEEKIKNEPVTILDNSKHKSILDRKGGIYKIYVNIFLNNKFDINIENILEDLYDNNEFVVFNLYFFMIPDLKDKTLNIDYKKIINHFSQYSLEILDLQITKVYKNTGLVACNGIIVWYPFYDINNLIKIASSIKSKILLNIDIINKTVNLDQKNTIKNFTEKVDLNSDILLLISANFDDPIIKIKKEDKN